MSQLVYLRLLISRFHTGNDLRNPLIWRRMRYFSPYAVANLNHLGG